MAHEAGASEASSNSRKSGGSFATSPCGSACPRTHSAHNQRRTAVSMSENVTLVFPGHWIAPLVFEQRVVQQGDDPSTGRTGTGRHGGRWPAPTRGWIPGPTRSGIPGTWSPGSSGRGTGRSPRPGGGSGRWCTGTRPGGWPSGRGCEPTHRHQPVPALVPVRRLGDETHPPGAAAVPVDAHGLPIAAARAGRSPTLPPRTAENRHQSS